MGNAISWLGRAYKAAGTELVATAGIGLILWLGFAEKTLSEFATGVFVGLLASVVLLIGLPKLIKWLRQRYQLKKGESKK